MRPWSRRSTRGTRWRAVLVTVCVRTLSRKTAPVALLVEPQPAHFTSIASEPPHEEQNLPPATLLPQLGHCNLARVSVSTPAVQSCCLADSQIWSRCALACARDTSSAIEGEQRRHWPMSS